MKKKDPFIHWSPDIQDWRKIEVDTAKFFIAQAESKLKETSETYNNISDRRDKLLSYAIGLISVSLGYFFTGKNQFLQTTAFFVLFFGLLAAILLVINLFPKTVRTVGEEPKDIFLSKFVDSYEGETQLVHLCYYILLNIQDKINLNKHTNTVRLDRNKFATIVLSLSPLGFLLGLLCYQTFNFQPF